ncbi:MAG: Fic family protein [Bifidobacteriaceae bacterium]|nr:Fic family protein [Bifidobacteriaceae bacterium]
MERLAYYYDQLNYIHPFRAGNGRAQRVFWSRVARDAGYWVGGPGRCHWRRERPRLRAGGRARRQVAPGRDVRQNRGRARPGQMNLGASVRPAQGLMAERSKWPEIEPVSQFGWSPFGECQRQFDRWPTARPTARHRRSENRDQFGPVPVRRGMRRAGER